MEFEHYIAVDWAQKNMAIAWSSAGSKPKVIDVNASMTELKKLLKKMPGKKIITFEETTTSQWLFTELKGLTDQILVCDPYRNKLLSEGPKTDKIDALKLLKLLKADFLKPVYHSENHFIYMRKLVSAYEDLIKMGVRLKNQRSALFRAHGKSDKDFKDGLSDPHEQFVLSGITKMIDDYESERSRYIDEFERLLKSYKTISDLESIPGIGVVGAIKIAAVVVDANRFPGKGEFHSYCGLIKHDRMSGGKSYGKATPRYSRTLKSVFKSAALSVIGENRKNTFKDYYDYLCTIKKCAPYDARNAVARRVATIVYGVMKSGKKYEPERIKKEAVSICNT